VRIRVRDSRPSDQEESQERHLFEQRRFRICPFGHFSTRRSYSLMRSLSDSTSRNSGSKTPQKKWIIKYSPSALTTSRQLVDGTRSRRYPPSNPAMNDVRRGLALPLRRRSGGG